ncbi:MAG TPA: hypothetical protein VFW96_11090 [Thermomicrobiales bacterium]|nr:hypothetical protein [Thermomicrobiales bacterium]
MGLLPGPWTPSLLEGAVRLGAWLPFPAASAALAAFAHTAVAEPTLRRRTEAAGAAYVAAQTAAAEHLARADPAPPAGPALLQLSVDGAMVPLVGGAWAEVKTLAIGVVQPPALEAGRPVIHTADLSYFSRLADHEAFARLALVETHRRGVETAGAVVAVSDGAAWAQAFADHHRPDAIRILDWCHAAGYLSQVAAACFAAGGAARWLDAQLRELLEGDPDVVLGKLRGLRGDLAARAGGAATPAGAAVAAALGYLEPRRAQIAYAQFRAAGYPIGSGAVESANKLVVEARLKGAGMHWARAHVDGMVALRTVVCGDRWDEAWPQIAAEVRRREAARLQRKRQARRAAATAAPAPLAGAGAGGAGTPACVLALPTSRHDDTLPRRAAAATAPRAPAPAPPPRPAPTHPWRRYRQPLPVK